MKIIFARGGVRSFFLVHFECWIQNYKFTLIFFPTRRGTLMFSPNPNLAPRALILGKSYIFIAYFGSMKLILLDSIKKQANNLKKRVGPNLFPPILKLIWPLSLALRHYTASLYTRVYGLQFDGHIFVRIELPAVLRIHFSAQQNCLC